MKRTRIFVLLSVLTGCAGLLGVPDLTFDEGADQGKPDGAVGEDGGDGEAADADGAPGAIDGSPPVTCNADLKSDPQHCGACGHDCANGQCKDGLCILTPELDGPAGLAIRDDELFIGLIGGDLGGVLRCATNGCFGTALAPQRISGDAGYVQVYKMAVVPPYVFAADYYGGGLWRSAINGGGALRLPAGAQPPKERSYGVATDGTTLYWTESAGAVHYCSPPDCASPGTLTSASDPWHIEVASSGEVVFTAGSGYELKACPPASKGACSPAALPNAGYIHDLTMDGTTAYWSSGSKILSCAPSCKDATTVVEDDAPILALAVSGSSVYWTTIPFDAADEPLENESKVKSCTIGACTGAGVRLIAEHQNAPNAIVVDAQSVYWANTGSYNRIDGRGAVVKAPR